MRRRPAPRRLARQVQRSVHLPAELVELAPHGPQRLIDPIDNLRIVRRSPRWRRPEDSPLREVERVPIAFEAMGRAGFPGCAEFETNHRGPFPSPGLPHQVPSGGTSARLSAGPGSTSIALRISHTPSLGPRCHSLSKPARRGAALPRCAVIGPHRRPLRRPWVRFPSPRAGGCHGASRSPAPPGLPSRSETATTRPMPRPSPHTAPRRSAAD